MHSLSRKLVAAVSASLFGLIAVGGHALHGLPGLSHSCDCGCVFHARAKCASHVGSDQPCAHRERTGKSSDQCPICNFLGLAKLANCVQPSVETGDCVASLSPAHYCGLADATVSPYAARGPPGDCVLFL